MRFETRPTTSFWNHIGRQWSTWVYIGHPGCHCVPAARLLQQWLKLTGKVEKSFIVLRAITRLSAACCDSREERYPQSSMSHLFPVTSNRICPRKMPQKNVEEDIYSLYDAENSWQEHPQDLHTKTDKTISQDRQRRAFWRILQALFTRTSEQRPRRAFTPAHSGTEHLQYLFARTA